MAQWLKCSAEPKDAGSIPGAGSAFQMQAKRENACVLRGLNYGVFRYGTPYSPAVAMAL